jgi:N-methylhydantoinase A/oxoprolinase/acetone carboxylase beta subunit
VTQADMARHRPVRVGIDVGGTFTKAIAIVPGDAHPLAEAVHPTTHHAPGGVSEGVAEVVRMLVARLGESGRGIELVAFSRCSRATWRPSASSASARRPT